MTQFIEFKRLPFQGEVKAISEILKSNGIEFKIENTKPSVDITFSNAAIVDYIIKVKESQFEIATALFEANLAIEVSEDVYYMDAYSDEEIIEIISLPKEWSSYDLAYARKLIKKRGITINEEELRLAKEKAIAEITEPNNASPSLIFVGYLCSILGGWIGLLVAIRLKYKTIRVNGENDVPYYTLKDQNHGAFMLYIFIFWAFVYLSLFIL